jgi:hypothetical protein
LLQGHGGGEQFLQTKKKQIFISPALFIRCSREEFVTIDLKLKNSDCPEVQTCSNRKKNLLYNKKTLFLSLKTI